MSSEPLFTNEQLAHFNRAFGEWVAVSKKVGTFNPDNITIDLAHSSLFRRIIERKPIYKYPPPKSFSYPWYALFETPDLGEMNDAWQYQLASIPGKLMILNQTVWPVEESISDLGSSPAWILTWPQYLLRIKVEEVPERKEASQSRHHWYHKITLLETSNILVGGSHLALPKDTRYIISP